MIPTVIQDAIHFVAALNERYLWVDSLCIVQNDMDMKHHQILQMGAIYNGAVASLVGVVGINANSGLAGVRPGTRIPEQKRIQYQNVYLVNPGPEQYTALRKPWDNSPYIKLGKRMKGRPLDLNAHLTGSNYGSRAWTYQERLLSRRCLYFMENMVYCHCRKAIRGENKAAPYTQKSQFIRPLCLFMADPIFSGNPLHYQRTLGAIYAGIVTEYTRKKLSFPLDVLDAFSGISSAMEKLCSWRLVVGMPENILEYALLWVPTEPSPRRPQKPENAFPSWSWAGWCAEVDYDTIFRNEAGFEPYLADMESLILHLSIYDQYGPRAIQSAVPVNKAASKLVGSSTRTEISDWLSRIGSPQIPKNVLLFQAYTLPFKNCEIFSHGKENPFVSASRPSLGPIQRTTVQIVINIQMLLPVFKTMLLGAGADILSITDYSNYDIVFLSISKGDGEDSDKWDTYRGCTNFLLIKWTGDFAERIAIGRTESVLTMVSRNIYGYGVGNTGTQDAFLDFCYWKTIRLV